MLKLSLSIMILIGLSAHAGTETSGGVENRTDLDNTAWFLNDSKIVRVCHVSAPNFDFTATELDSKITRAFKTWRDYMKLKKVSQTDPLGDREIANQISIQNCDGTEDIKFYFGTSDDVIERLLPKYNNPFGFATMTSYDRAAAWGKGVVWIAASGSVEPHVPNWKNGSSLDGILLHEVGHVLGNSHFSGTIMDDNLSKALSGGAQSEEFFTTIDHERELKPNFDLAKNYRGPLWDEGQMLEHTFTHLLGRQIEARKTSIYIQKSEGATPVGKLIILDGQKEYSFPFAATTFVTLSMFDATLFKTVYESRPRLGSEQSGSSDQSFGESWLGNLLVGGKNIPVSISLNLGKDGLKIEDLSDPEDNFPLFYGSVGPAY